MVFIILQILSTKFNHFVTTIETKLYDKEEVFTLENLSILLLKHEETINNKTLISYPKEKNVALDATKMTLSKKKFKNHKKTAHAHPRKNVMKDDNNHHCHKGKSNKLHVLKEIFDGN